MVEPSWATPIIEDVLFLHNRTKRPKIVWKAGRGSGVTKKRGMVRRNGYSYRIRRWRGTPDIICRVNDDVARGKIILLHELSHWLLRATHRHDKTFWRKAWDLYFFFLSPEEIEKAKHDEFWYKDKAKEVYQEFV